MLFIYLLLPLYFVGKVKAQTPRLECLLNRSIKLQGTARKRRLYNSKFSERGQVKLSRNSNYQKGDIVVEYPLYL